MARFVEQIEARCPWCYRPIRGLATQRQGQHLTNGDVVMCYACRRPSIWTAVAEHGELSLPSDRQLVDLMENRAAVFAWCEAIVRDEPGLVGLFRRAVWPDGWSQEREEER